MQIQTVTGEISSDELGATLMHEHLLMGFAGWESDTGAPAQDEEEMIRRCVDRIEELKAGGFSSLLDPCPTDLGRDPEFYAKVAERTGFNILFATGIYNEFLGSPYWRFKIDWDPDGADHLANMYVDELTEGVGPSRRRPAVIKLAVGKDPESNFENKAVKAAALASKATGAPIITHTEGVGGDLLLDKLKALGVPAHRIIIGHSCDSSDAAYHRRIVDGGSYIGFDRFGLVYQQSDEERVRHLHSLIEDGYSDQLIVSQDCAFCQRGRAMPEAGLATNPMHFSQNIAPKLRALGVAQATLDGIFRDNPRRYFEGGTLAR
jgi:phosphotriesterase-related protein